jgi:hypothetical protein
MSESGLHELDRVSGTNTLSFGVLTIGPHRDELADACAHRHDLLFEIEKLWPYQQNVNDAASKLAPVQLLHICCTAKQELQELDAETVADQLVFVGRQGIEP